MKPQREDSPGNIHTGKAHGRHHTSAPTSLYRCSFYYHDSEYGQLCMRLRVERDNAVDPHWDDWIEYPDAPYSLEHPEVERKIMRSNVSELFSEVEAGQTKDWIASRCGSSAVVRIEEVPTPLNHKRATSYTSPVDIYWQPYKTIEGYPLPFLVAGSVHEKKVNYIEMDDRPLPILKIPRCKTTWCQDCQRQSIKHVWTWDQYIADTYIPDPNDKIWCYRTRKTIQLQNGIPDENCPYRLELLISP